MSDGLSEHFNAVTSAKGLSQNKERDRQELYCTSVSLRFFSRATKSTVFVCVRENCVCRPHPKAV